MSKESNLGRLKAACDAWDASKGGSTKNWLALMDDHIQMRSVDESAAGMSFAKQRHSKEEAVAFMATLMDDWEMIHFTGETYLETGDCVAMFGRSAWTCKATGKSTEVQMAQLWRFVEDKAVDYTEVFDSAKMAAAATPD